MDNAEARLRIVEAVVPQATKVGLTQGEPVIETCKKLEEYVFSSDKGGEKPASPAARKKRQPRKKATTDKSAGSPVAPTHEG